ncbi:ankyrin repeat-containing protein [Pyrus ussuriensis x Pyrus communis]|uniref:Ankyrin repeat-containing protein n=1 Tax=Pyrus ussuriensis x Pyrus communis TaxID=2448454 RepID=A0A5N5GBD4_9ROSA|nr:ankyrin repeat-containing protein [Pyrus ussuriensis x Pyrus communis]
MGKLTITNTINLTGFEYSRCKPFFEAVQAGRWETARDFHIQHPEAVRVRHPFSGKTALHIAVEAGHVDIVRELVSLMEEDDLEIKSTEDVTALAIAAMKGITEMAECMVTKNKKLLSIPGVGNHIPLVLACACGHWHVARYLYSVTPLEDLMPDKGPHGARIISNCLPFKEFDIAWDLINRCPKLAFTGKNREANPFVNLTRMASSFRSGVELNFWQQRIYDSIDIQPPRRINHISVTVQNEEISQANNGRRSIRSVGGLVEQLVSHSKKQKEGLVSKIVEILGIKCIYEMKIVHVNSLAFLKLVCEEINKDLDKQQMSYSAVRSAIFEAVRNGNVEFITHICKANPELLWATNNKSRGIFDFAIEYRQEKIYNLLYGISAKERVIQHSDSNDNTKLHTAGLLSPSAQAQLNRIPGAALQMQRELQWYKEVETIVPPRFLEWRNDEILTARELFTKSHSELLKEGEKWMKETATSYTVVGALIITIMFAAIITIPGGNKDTGFPAFIDEKLFMLFMISDAISLFSSTTATLTFLGILTSRYAEDDFLKSLPTQMIIGLATLFFAIATMMIAFSAALLIIVRGQSWIVIPTILLSSVPVTLFAWMQFPLLVRITISTYGKGIFNRNVERWL